MCTEETEIFYCGHFGRKFPKLYEYNYGRPDSHEDITMCFDVDPEAPIEPIWDRVCDNCVCKARSDMVNLLKVKLLEIIEGKRRLRTQDSEKLEWMEVDQGDAMEREYLGFTRQEISTEKMGVDDEHAVEDESIESYKQGIGEVIEK